MKSNSLLCISTVVVLDYISTDDYSTFKLNMHMTVITEQVIIWYCLSSMININNIPILDFLNSSQSFTEESLKFQKFPSVLQHKTLVDFQISQWYVEEKNIFEEQRLRSEESAVTDLRHWGGIFSENLALLITSCTYSAAAVDCGCSSEHCASSKQITPLDSGPRRWGN